MDEQVRTLALYVAGFGLGGVVVGAATLPRTLTQVGLALVLGGVGFLLFHSDTAVAPIFHSPGGDLVGFSLAALAILGVSRLLFSLRPDLRGFVSRTLTPQAWDPQPAPPLTSTDLAKRWFVTISAATGAVVGSLITRQQVLELLRESLTPGRLLTALLLTIVSISLIGPLEEIVLGVGARNSGDQGRHDRGAPFETLLQQLSWRSAGRVALVLVTVVQLNLLHRCIEEQIHDGASETTLMILLATVPTAVVTYFWCAALQRGVRSIEDSAGRAGTLAMALLTAPGFLVGACAGFVQVFHAPEHAGPHGPLPLLLMGEAIVAVIMLVVAGLISLVFGLGPTVVVANALESQRQKPEIPPLRTVLSLTISLAVYQAIVVTLGLILMEKLMQTDFPGTVYMEGLLSVMTMVGWGAGLAVSGFPDVLRHAPRPNPPPAPVNSSQP